VFHQVLDHAHGRCPAGTRRAGLRGSVHTVTKPKGLRQTAEANRTLVDPRRTVMYASRQCRRSRIAHRPAVRNDRLALLSLALSLALPVAGCGGETEGGRGAGAGTTGGAIAAGGSLSGGGVFTGGEGGQTSAAGASGDSGLGGSMAGVGGLPSTGGVSSGGTEATGGTLAGGGSSAWPWLRELPKRLAPRPRAPRSAIYPAAAMPTAPSWARRSGAKVATAECPAMAARRPLAQSPPWRSETTIGR
jgi:hypothetical protein